MRKTRLLWIPSTLAAAVLSACGGGELGVQTTSTTLTLQQTAPTQASAAAVEVQAEPTFHVAAVDLDAPDNSPAPHRQQPSAALAGLASRGLTAQDIAQALQRRSALASTGGEAAPLASTSTVTTYTPAQIRAAYKLPALPSSTAGLTAAQAAQLGAGQTIYIVNAKHDPNLVAELAAFNAQFGLPACSSRTLAASTALPLAAASSTGCELVIAYSTSAGALTATAPAYDSGWATEIALDVQWAHATAPLARLVLIEAPDAGVTSLSNAVALANKMGSGVVSMSFGAAEGSWTTSYDSVFSASGMSYLAATGDGGSAVSWPSVSSKVLAVGGTTLSYSGSGARSEVAWASTGGGVSSYVAVPGYQSALVSSLSKRAVADVAFNADPNSGQYVASIPSGSSSVRWLSAGGTSLSTPQWAGLIAVANALRAAAGKTVLGAPHSVLYGQVAAVPATYGAAFADVSSGSNGSCSVCTAKAGYDTPTGWGTPNASALLSTLSGATVSSSTGSSTTSSTGPVIGTTSLSGSAGKALSGTIAISSAGATSLSISISGVPSGMSFASASGGISVSWAKPVAGSYPLSLTVKDNLGRSTTGTVTITISK